MLLTMNADVIMKRKTIEDGLRHLLINKSLVVHKAHQFQVRETVLEQFYLLVVSCLAVSTKDLRQESLNCVKLIRLNR